MSENKLSLEEFHKVLVAKLYDFKIDWRLNHKEDPINWPMELGFADWLEHFEIMQEQ